MQSEECLITVVLAVRNRGGVRLRNCLKSLRWQEGVPARQVEILLSDFGSAPPCREDIAQIGQQYGARVHFTPATGIWNKPRALNIAIKRARGKFTMCTDVDMIFAPNFLRSALDVQTETGGRALVLCRCHDLGPETEGRPVELSDLPGLQRTASLRPAYGVGGCQCALTRWFHHVRGYDQGYTGWGAEDMDLVRRAEQAGLSRIWMTDRTGMLHQWHPTAKFDRPLLVRRNRFRLRVTSWIVRKNWFGWGE
jgi:glycosyltransferase involved in cell wall biosynthesis